MDTLQHFLATNTFLQGLAFPFPILPDLAKLSSMSVHGPVLTCLSLLPIVLAADGCHMNVLPVAQMMQPRWTARSMDGVVAASMMVATIFYVLFSIAAYSEWLYTVSCSTVSGYTPCPVVRHLAT